MTSARAFLNVQDVNALDPLVRWSADPDQIRHIQEQHDHLGWLRTTKDGKPWATILGQNDDVAVSLARQLAGHGFAGITSHAAVWPALWSVWPGRRLEPTADPDVGLWSLWMCRTAEIAERHYSSRLLLPDDPRIRPLLSFSSSAHVFPADEAIVRWVGIEQDGVLVAVAGQIRAQGGAGEIVSVCTNPDYRGRGFAADCVSHLVTRARHDGLATMILEAYTRNQPAAAVYRRVGFAEVGRYASWELTCSTSLDLS